jgi:hypothetical protein
MFAFPQQGNAQARDQLLPSQPLILLWRNNTAEKAACSTAAFVLSAPVCKSPGGSRDSTCLEAKDLDAICKSTPEVLSDEVRGFEDKVLTQLSVIDMQGGGHWAR